MTSSAGQYRKRLYEGLRRKLPSDHSLADVYADDLSDPIARNNFEKMLIEAAMAEAAKPSAENLPRDGSLIRRDLVDETTGSRTINWHGSRSFIADMGRPSQLVLRFIDPRKGIVIMGEPFDRVP